MKRTFEMELGGKNLNVEIGEIAQLANGSVLVNYGGTVVLVTACASDKPKEGIDFFPLSVDFEERLYAVGKIPGGFIKREGRPTEKAILTSRLIDRPIRPLFPEGYRNDVQIIATVLSVDKNSPPDIVAMIGSSIALSISDIPFLGPTGSVAVGYIDNKFILNPTSEEREKSELHLVVSGTKDAIMMVEAGAKELSEEQVLESIMFGHNAIREIVQFIEGIVEEVGKEKAEIILFDVDSDIDSQVREFCSQNMRQAIKTKDKQEREESISKVENETLEKFLELYPDNKKTIETILYNIKKEEVRNMIINDGIRPDDRSYEEIRTITSRVEVLPRTHGSALFTRGQTQVLTVATLGALGDVQILDGLGDEESKRYMHHYNFPPYSVGETRFLRGPGRREIGHGALAERALEPMIPSEDEFPYTIRLVSEVVASNGSTSQASVCGSTLALMDAGVPIKSPVAGIAMGLIKEEDKVAIFIKIQGIDRSILERALEQARLGRLHILEKMLQAIDKPRPEVSPHAPKIIITHINPDKIRDVIGPGGKMINKIISETGVKIDIEDTGKVYIAAVDATSGNKALKMIENIVKEVEVGEIYLGKVLRVTTFGAFVEIAQGKEGLVHISKLAKERVEKVEDVVKVGDEILVKVTEIDKQGRINLSRKDALPQESEENKE